MKREVVVVLVLLYIIYKIVNECFPSILVRIEYFMEDFDRTWYHHNGLKLNPLLVKNLKAIGYRRISNHLKDHCEIYFPKNNKELKSIVPKDRTQKFAKLNNTYLFTIKKNIWLSLLNKFGRKKAAMITPESYIFPYDKELFKRKYHPGKTYVLKKEVHRQEGVVITRNKHLIMNHAERGYSLVQEYINNSFLYYGYKINLRVYLLITCHQSRIRYYMYNDGIVSYTKNMDNNQDNFDTVVASFYSSKGKYDEGYPIIISELRPKLLELGVDFKRISFKMENILKILINAVDAKVCHLNSMKMNLNFEYFGVDFLLTKDLNPMMMEINMGPGMTPYNERDTRMRYKLMGDILQIIGVKQRELNNGFKEI